MPQPAMIQLASIQSFHVGGRRQALSGRAVEQRVLAQGGQPRALDMNGDHMVGQLYAQFYTQASPTRALPVVLWHGGGMTGANWEATPDGRPGWLQHFLEAGLHVCVSDAMERGRASWALWPELYEQAPVMRSMQEGWDMFRVGPLAGYSSDASQRRAHAGQRFPVECFDQFACQWVPRWTGHENRIMQAYEALLARIGPCVLIGHSQGGGFALRAAALWPQWVKAVVALEPSGAPVDVPLSGPLPPHLVLWGDHIEQHPAWVAYRRTVEGHATRLRAAGAAVEVVDLAARGLPGHSHFPMLDHGSDAVCALVIDWITRQAAA